MVTRPRPRGRNVFLLVTLFRVCAVDIVVFILLVLALVGSMQVATPATEIVLLFFFG